MLVYNVGWFFTALDTSRAEFHPVELRFIVHFVAYQQQTSQPLHSLVVRSGSMPANHQHAKLFIPIRLDSLTLAECYSAVSFDGGSNHLDTCLTLLTLMLSIFILRYTLLRVSGSRRHDS